MLYNGSMMHYLCSRAGQGSSHITDGVNVCNASLLCFQPIKNAFSICVQLLLKLSDFQSYKTLLKNVEVSLKGGNRERKAANKGVLTVSGCLPAPLTALSRLMSGGAVCLLGWGRGHCPGFHVFNSCRLPAEPT